MEKSEVDWKQMRKLSSDLFGSQHRLPVAIAALELEPDIYPEAVKNRAGMANSNQAKTELEKLVKAKLLKKAGKRAQPGKPGPKRQVYARRDDEFWDCLSALSRRRFNKG